MLAESSLPAESFLLFSFSFLFFWGVVFTACVVFFFFFFPWSLLLLPLVHQLNSRVAALSVPACKRGADGMPELGSSVPQA
jgi:hypothetical protein